MNTPIRVQDALFFLDRPGVLEKKWKAPQLLEKEKSQIKNLVKKGALLCKKERQREGKVLGSYFQKVIKGLNASLIKIKCQIPLQEKKERLALKKKMETG